MRSAFRYGTLALVACIGVAAAGDLIEDDIVTGTVGLAATEHALALDDEQRGRIFLGVINVPDVPDESLAEADTVEPLPSEVALQDLPAMVTRQVPAVRGYKFVKVEDYILLVSPTTRAVVAYIPRFKLVE